MAKKDPPLEVELPRAADDKPAWSRVGIIGVAGFVIGIAWPRVAGIHIGPNPPSDARPAETAAPSASASAPAPAVASAAPAASASAAPQPENVELVVVGEGKIVKCRDKKDKKLDDCGKLQFDPVATPKLKGLASCPSALGLEGKLSIGFDVDFKKKEVHVLKGKKTTLPSSTVRGVLQCAAKDFANVALDDVPHEHRRYTLFYTATFYPPGKHPDDTAAKPDKEGDDDAAGKTTSEDSASGSAIVSWDTALVRKEPKDGDVVARVVKGTKLKLVGKQNDWYRVEIGSKSGWVYRGAIGL